MSAGSHRRSLRREQRSVEQGLQEFQREVGDVVTWYEFDPAASSGGDTFAEGPIPDVFDPTLPPSAQGRHYKAPKYIPFIWEVYQAPAQIQTEAGFYTINTVSLKFSSDEFRRAGVRSPEDPDAHYNDRFFYNGYLYRVETFTPRGWIHQWFPVIDVMGHQLRQADIEDEPSPPDEESTETSTPWTPGQQLDWPFQEPGDVVDQP